MELPTLYATTLNSSSSNVGEMALHLANTRHLSTPYQQSNQVFVDFDEDEQGFAGDAPTWSTHKTFTVDAPVKKGALMFMDGTAIRETADFSDDDSSNDTSVSCWFTRQPTLEEEMARRLVRVIIADSDENLDMKEAVLYDGTEQWTELTDNELFFEIAIQDLLDSHNNKRAATLDKDRSDQFGRDVMLEPIRIKDLSMSVVTVAQF